MYVYLVFLVKIIFIILAIYDKTLKRGGKKDATKENTITFWKERVEFIFVFLMSLLLIYIFFPRANRLNLINGEVKMLLFLFGFVLLITANWSIFFQESKLLNNTQNILGRTGSH
jgi:hypothetical protein